jgi:hypothetical protein
MLLWIDWEWLQKRNMLMLTLSTALAIGFILLCGFKASFQRYADSSTLTQDLLIQNAEITIYQGNLIIPYITKPLIVLFWLGSFMILVQPCFVLLFSYLKGKKLL